MYAQGEKGQSLDDMVAPANVVLLMEDDVALLLLGQRGGQINFRSEDTHDKGRVDIVGQINVIPQRQGTYQFAAEPQ